MKCRSGSLQVQNYQCNEQTKDPIGIVRFASSKTAELYPKTGMHSITISEGFSSIISYVVTLQRETAGHNLQVIGHKGVDLSTGL